MPRIGRALLCREGLSADKENILFLGNALTTLCERLEIEALSNRRSEEATLFAKLQVQFKKLADDGFGESRAERLPLTRSNGAPSHAPASSREAAVGSGLPAGAPSVSLKPIVAPTLGGIRPRGAPKKPAAEKTRARWREMGNPKLTKPVCEELAKHTYPAEYAKAKLHSPPARKKLHDRVRRQVRLISKATSAT